MPVFTASKFRFSQSMTSASEVSIRATNGVYFGLLSITGVKLPVGFQSDLEKSVRKLILSVFVWLDFAHDRAEIDHRRWRGRRSIGWL